MKPIYIGFWARLVAYLLDSIVLLVAIFVINFIFAVFVIFIDGSVGEEFFTATGYMFVIIISWLYYSLFESSKLQGTLGKMVMNMKVVDYEYGRITFGRATGRYFAKILSGLILYIGYIMIAFHPKKQGLHDIIANTYVIEK